MSATVIEQLRDGLVVSCQAPPDHPLRTPAVIARLAECAQHGGAVGLRINSAAHIAAARRRTQVPIVGLHKVRGGGAREFITPDMEYAARLAVAGADLVAVEASTEVPGDPLALLGRIRAELGLPVMADVSTLTEGLRAWDAGADIVATTLSGYTGLSGYASLSSSTGPDIRLVAELAGRGVRTVAEGRFVTAEQVRQAFAAGAWAVVIGNAITDPIAITRRFVQATPQPGRAG